MTTGIGSMPHTDADEACAEINRHFSLPFWPQLPSRSPLENMYVQFSEGFPGVRVNNGVITVDRNGGFDNDLEQLYYNFDDNNYSNYSISPGYAAGLYSFLRTMGKNAPMVKGQITGPVSWGLSAIDEQGRGILYDELLAETIARFLKLKAMWQENMLKSVSKTTIIFVDEPYLASLGSAFVAISGEQVKTLLEGVLSGIQGIRGIHCCGGTDWSLLLDSSADVLSFDTYNYADSLATYVNNVNSFIKRGGTIAWGIVPNEEYGLMKETLSSLYDRLGEAMSPYTYDGISFRQLAEQSIITPSCALTSLSKEAAVHVMELLVELSDKMKSKYL
jgi:methionine synthase II (cobalamin-independent)